MSKGIILAALIVGAGALSISGQTPTSRRPLAPAINTPLELTVTAVDGSKIDLSKLRGKVVLLDFWATRCPPCVEGMPEVLATYKKFHEKGLEIIGISTDESKETLIRFVTARGIRWPQYLDENRELNTRWNIGGLPTMWLIDKKGLLVNTEAGADLPSNIEKLLAQE
jgi:peroxiredoxin